MSTPPNTSSEEVNQYRILSEAAKSNQALTPDQQQHLAMLAEKLHLPNPLKQTHITGQESEFLTLARQHYEEDAEETTRKGWISTVINAVEILGGALLLAFVINMFIFQPYEVVGVSMQPTLQSGDRLIVSKLGHTWSQITKKNYIPKRYDVVVLKSDFSARASGGSSENQLVKRVIGLPGDRVVVKDGKITVFNQEFPQGFNPDEKLVTKNIRTEQSSDTNTWEIKDGEVFVAGDNRPNSLDSRAIGPVPSDHLVGSVQLRLLPLSEARFF